MPTVLACSASASASRVLGCTGCASMVVARTGRRQHACRRRPPRHSQQTWLAKEKYGSTRPASRWNFRSVRLLLRGGSLDTFQRGWRYTLVNHLARSGLSLAAGARRECDRGLPLRIPPPWPPIWTGVPAGYAKGMDNSTAMSDYAVNARTDSSLRQSCHRGAHRCAGLQHGETRPIFARCSPILTSRSPNSSGPSKGGVRTRD